MKKHWSKIIWLILALILIYSRLVNLEWGLPYPMHPDERNIVISIVQLRCDEFPSVECFNPHFFAYGQFPLYLAYGIASLLMVGTGTTNTFLTNEAAVMALRYISATSSIFTVWLLVKITVLLAPFASRSIRKAYEKAADFSMPGIQNQVIKQTTQYFASKYFHYLYLISLLFIFSPGLIQLAHYGTTESLLMFFYTVFLYLGLKLLLHQISLKSYVLLVGIIGGLALATKVSSLIFFIVPFMTLGTYIFQSYEQRRLLHYFFICVNLVSIALLFFILFSPFNFISLPEFLGAMRYESDVATGKYVAFYTRQFSGTIPILFQFNHIFPYVLGWPVFILSILGFMFLPFNRLMNLLRFSFLTFFIPTAFLFAKWTRFMSPIFPIMILLAVLILIRLWYKIRLLIGLLFKNQTVLETCRFLLFISTVALVLSCIVPGMAFLSIYQRQDVRFAASKWVYNNIPVNSLILSETANVVDIPIATKDFPEELSANKVYNYISFNFYDLDNNTVLQSQLEDYMQRASYIFMPSRRVFMNHTCLTEKNYQSWLKENSSYNAYIDLCQSREEEYFLLNNYYRQLFSGESGFQKVAEYTSYPRIELFGKTLVEFPDEQAEESWTVFDHPVIRIYKRV